MATRARAKLKKPTRGGRKPWSPDDKEREMVKAMVMAGIDRETIAKVLGTTAKTLRKACAEELRTAATLAVTKVAGALFRAATVDGNVSAMIFFLKTRGRWSEAKAEESEKPQVQPTINLNLSGIKPDASSSSE